MSSPVLFDVLADEGIAFAQRLADSGVLVTHRHHADQAHDFVMMVNYLPIADDVVRDTATAIRECLEAGGSA